MTRVAFEALSGTEAGAEPYSKGYSRYVLIVLSSVYMLNLVDRGLIGILLEPIKQDLLLSDTQLGLLTGIAFGVFYAVFGVPIAVWADRGNRVTITSLAIGLWGLTVMSFLFVGNFLQLLIARMAAGIGEAGCKPPTYALVGDYFPEPRERTRALAVYIGGSYLANPLSLIVGGFLNEIVGWRWTFFIMGVPGLILAAIVALTVSEPRKHKSKPAAIGPKAESTVISVVRLIYANRSVRHLCLGMTMLYTMTLGLAPWYGAFMIRAHQMSTSELGVAFGILGLGGLVGAFLSGILFGRQTGGEGRYQLVLCAAAVALIVPFYVGFLTSPHAYLALICFAPLSIIGGFIGAPIYALLQRLVADNMRATMLTVLMLIVNLVGFGIGPLLVGIVSDLLQPTFGQDSLRFAMLTLSLIALWSAVHFWIAAKYIERDLQEAPHAIARIGPGGPLVMLAIEPRK